MKWEELFPKLTFEAMFCEPPKISIIHLGSNDLTVVVGKVLESDIKQDLVTLKSLFPKTNIVYSAILPRLAWTGADSFAGIERKRKQVNGRIRRYLCKDRGVYLEHSEITSDISGFFARDCVHLADIGIDMMLFQFRDCIESLL